MRGVSGPGGAGSAASGTAEAWATACGFEGFVKVVGDDVELAFSVAVDAVVAVANPVAVFVLQDEVEGQEAEDVVDIEDGVEGFFELVGWGLIEDAAEARASQAALSSLVFIS